MRPRRVVRRAVRRARFRRYLLFRLPWIITRRTFTLFFFGTLMYKLHMDDVRRIEMETGKSPQNLTEDDLKAAMRKLGIQKLEITPEDNEAIANHEKERGPFCTYCGAKLAPDAVFCSNCGSNVEY
jgi:ribosomal protein L40E